MAFSSVLQMYLGWANSLLCEQGILIDGLHQLRDGTIFCHLIELLTGTQLLPSDQDALANESDTLALDTVQTALDYLAGIGIKMSVSAEGVLHGELKSILDVMWSIILHCTIHSPDRAAYQRTVRNGRKLLLQWCDEELEANVNTNKSMASTFSGSNHLSDLLSLRCSFDNDQQNKDKYLVNLTNGILAAEDHFGLSKTLLGPADVINGTADEHSLMIYIALLRRKVRMLISRRCSFSSDDEEFIKISPKKQSPNTSILSTGNSVYSERSSAYSHLSTPQPPHHRYGSDYPLSNKPTSAGSPPSHMTPMTLDITPEKSDSGISTTASGPSSSSSSVPGVIAARSRDRREWRLDWRDTEGGVLGATPSSRPRQEEGIPRDASKFPQVSRRNDHRQQERMGVMPNTTETGIAANIPPRSAGSKDYSASGYDSRTHVNQAALSLTSNKVTTEEREGYTRVKIDEDKRELAGNCKDSGAKEDEPVRTPEDELLHLLDTIGKESHHLRLELDETQQREAMLKTQLEEETVGSTKEEQVISKLVQELEMLRAENRRLFRESASAKNANALDKKAMEKLNATIGKLQVEVEHQNAENFSLRMKSKAGSDLGSVEARRGSDAVSQSSGFIGSREMSELCDLKRDLARAEAQKEFLDARLKETEEEMKGKLKQTTEELRTTRLENLRLEKECKLLRMSNETSRLEVETVSGRCRRLEEYLSHAQKRNNKLAQQLEEEAFRVSSQSEHDQNAAVVVKLEEENALLKEKLELSDEERKLLKQELAHYRQNKTTLDEVLRAWDVQTSSKFQSFLDDFRLHVNEQRDQQGTKITKDPGTELSGDEKQNAPSEASAVMHSARSTASLRSERSSIMSERWPTSEMQSGESIPSADDREGTEPLTAENLAAATRIHSVVDDKYLQPSPIRVDTDTEVDSEMDSQITDEAFSDLPNGYLEQGGQVAPAGGVAKTKFSDGIRRPSLGDLIVAKAQNSPPDDEDAHRRDPARDNLKMPNFEPESQEKDERGASGVGGVSSDAQAASASHPLNSIPRNHRIGKMRFSAVNSSLESLREITKKAKQNPVKALASAEEGSGTVVINGTRRDGANPAGLSGKQNENHVVKAGGDSQKILDNGDIKITNGHGSDYSNQMANKASYDSQSLPERGSSSFQIHQRASPMRVPRWRRMQNRFQPALDGSYLGTSKVDSSSVQDNSAAEQKQDTRNRSCSLDSPLNSNSSKPSNQLEDSDTGLNSFESEESEYARLPERRNVAQQVLARGTFKTGVDQKSEVPTHREQADGSTMNGDRGREGSGRHQGNLENHLRSEVQSSTLGSIGKSHFSPQQQRLGYLRSKLGIKLERELLNSSSGFQNNLHKEQNPPAPRKTDTNPEPTSQSQPSKPCTGPSSNTNGGQGPASQSSLISDSMPDSTEDLRGSDRVRSAPVSKSSSPDTSKMSPSSYSQYYKHKMMAEQDQEYANSIIDKYLNQP